MPSVFIIHVFHFLMRNVHTAFSSTALDDYNVKMMSSKSGNLTHPGTLYYIDFQQKVITNVLAIPFSEMLALSHY